MLVMARRDLLATGSPVTEQPVLPAGTKQETGIKEPR